ncbi:hypothetical protein PanWU01x14_205210 [Parasponia andersonii]|uniref:S-locus receptor kinase C-terminal domain-containing protein n=1 Tax=Parasponia andersonii TaxID=3476 RepID=A0A2P5BW17_PARAD|nr:hypothetical protein PanWU01x14_205210 [Parasponia andersonii]
MDDRATELLDGCLRESLYHNVKQVLHCIHIGLLCVQQRPLDRLSMSFVVLMLSSDNTELPRLKKPGYYKSQMNQ